MRPGLPTLEQCWRDAEARPYLMVYGTLRRGCGANDMLLDGFEPAGMVRLDGYCMAVSGIPYIYPKPGRRVVGEAYRIIDGLSLPSIDAYESGSYYRAAVEPVVTGPIPPDRDGRDVRTGSLAAGTVLKAWVYVARPDRARDIEQAVLNGRMQEAEDYREAYRY